MILFKIFISAFLINNVVLLRFIALCPFIGMSTDEDKSFGMGLAVTFVTVIATCVTWPIYRYILEPAGMVFLQLLVFILVIASLVQLVEFYLKKSAPALYASMGIYLALITTNCAILAVTLDVINNVCTFTGQPYTFVQSVVYAIGVAAGFLLALLLLAGVRRRIRTSPIPAFLKGAPILFVSSGLLSIAFMGFSGLVK
ncbi:electron transport complex subunit RsxA [Spirochaetia bacterium]|nr:electron transport complex subunit RsxA [Spirochaetia bacterium]GHV76349.1 electron transport complex subunit RsxA [Spirochaetia bacterium]